MSEYEILDPASHPAAAATTGPAAIDLVDTVGCEEMRGKVWYLHPGDALNYHRQAEQEELYVVLEGPAQIHIAGEDHEIQTGGVVRIPPETIRQVRNESADTRQVWLIIGAPPVEGDGRPLERDDEE